MGKNKPIKRGVYYIQILYTFCHKSKLHLEKNGLHSKARLLLFQLSANSRIPLHPKEMHVAISKITSKWILFNFQKTSFLLLRRRNVSQTVIVWDQWFSNCSVDPWGSARGHQGVCKKNGGNDGAGWVAACHPWETRLPGFTSVFRIE